jgi:hypothetical protein
MAIEFKEDKKLKKKPFVKGESVKTLNIMYKVTYSSGSLHLEKPQIFAFIM